MATSVKISSKNQIVVPKAARDALELKSGQRLLVTVRDDGVIEMRKAAENPVERLEGMLQRADDEELWPEARCE
ncbi:MAG TPA: AbrB/MazE/SpoVT family DNA-binding domain-containing protein [Gemmatimonadota bacterium]|nr:AbrB/MazE/SpoVT family DNA-binding domain-containing protein [Gemmatimonadota bacterium]